MEDKKLEERLKLEYGRDSITWEELAKKYKAMYPDLELEETLDRALMKWEDGNNKMGTQYSNISNLSPSSSS